MPARDHADVVATAFFAVAALLLPSPLVAVPMAITLLLAPTANAALFAAMLRTTPEDMRGRVNNTVILAATGLAALAPLTAGLLVQHFSGRWALAVFAAAIGAASDHVHCTALAQRRRGRSCCRPGRVRSRSVARR